MLTEEDVVARVSRLTVTRLRVFVSQGLIKPEEDGVPAYSEADIARAALICNLEDEMGFDEEDVPVLLNLIDQIHGLRSELRGFVEVIDALPPDVRTTVRLRIEQWRRG
ncbi:MerR family transcriptional regulator [Methyloceanibacter sp. wino2]|uniref:MerR family transcriptional regulator n=1 Tax=Methyloceanibacter sp. wino2 TaxID=2170729 RepID=UPI000D3E3E06|nr:MerR family transcriptional regulator [Methyloceanibacter sp. wino2]